MTTSNFKILRNFAYTLLNLKLVSMEDSSVGNMTSFAKIVNLGQIFWSENEINN